MIRSLSFSNEGRNIYIYIYIYIIVKAVTNVLHLL
jgi:hypothetical protein